MIDRESESAPQPQPAAGPITDEALRVAASWLAEQVHEAEIRYRGDRAAEPKDWLEERYFARLSQMRVRAIGPETKLGLGLEVALEEYFRVIIKPRGVYGYCGPGPRPSFVWPVSEWARLAGKWS